MLTALVVLPALVAVLLMGPPLVGVSIIGLCLLLGLFEFYALLGARSLQPFRTTGVLLTSLIFLEQLRPLALGASLWPFVALLLLTAALRRVGDLARTVPSSAGTFLGATYLGALGGAMAGLLLLAPAGQGGWRVLLLLGIVMISDSFAYFVGHALGRHRLAPTLSPGKTVEGALGGLLGGALGAWLLRELGLPGLPLLHALLLGVTVAAMGIVGDLFESLLKRWAGVKDSGNLFPGHGGMLDRLDSLLFGAPVLYYYFVLCS